MSKVDAQRAMRDARYAAYQARKDSAGESPVTPAPAAAARKAESVPVVAPPPAQPDAATEALCGHRSIGNKSCTRPADHAEKSHRYS